MNLRTLIQQLQAIEAEHGPDVEVVIDNRQYYMPAPIIRIVEPYGYLKRRQLAFAAED